MFLGHALSRCTLKNQITFPSKFRKEIGDHLFITTWFENSLVILPYEAGADIMSLLTDKASALLPEVRTLERFLYGGAEKITLDHEGRFILPYHLKEYARIEKEVVFRGVGERIELWDTVLYEKYAHMTDRQAREAAISLYNQIKNKQ